MKRSALFIVLTALVAIVAACSSPDGNARVNADVGLKGEDFKQVSAAMVYHCGTIDCHGDRFRNMRLYGWGGLRLNPNLEPDDQKLISQPEVDANYQSVVGVEPELFAQVVGEGGQNPERLALVAKARAVQNHKGGPVMKPGDDIDNCITAWLRKDVAAVADACRKANVLNVQ